MAHNRRKIDCRESFTQSFKIAICVVVDKFARVWGRINKRIVLPCFLPFCVRAKFWDGLILPQILVVFKSPTTKIDFVDFLQIQAAFWKTNYTTFSYLLISMYGQDMSEIKFLTAAASCSIFTDIRS